MYYPARQLNYNQPRDLKVFWNPVVVKYPALFPTATVIELKNWDLNNKVESPIANNIALTDIWKQERWSHLQY